MTDTQMWELVVGFLSATFVLPLIQQPQPRWTARLRALVTFLWSIIVGLITAYLTGAFGGIHDFRQGVTAVLTMLISAIASYHGFAQPTGIAPALERLTSPSDPPRPAPPNYPPSRRM